MGAQLIRRTTHSLALTPAGQDLLYDARALIAGWDAFEERHAGSDGTVRGALKVVAPVALGQTHLADIAVGFQLRHPQVKLTWMLDDQPIRFAEIGCDCWIKIGAVPDDTLVARPLGRVERLLAAAPDLIKDQRPHQPKDLESLPLIALAPFEGGDIRLTAADGTEAAIPMSLRMTTNNILAAYRAAKMGAGAAIVPRWFVADDLAEGSLVDLLPGWRAAELVVHAAFLPARYQPKRLELLLDTLANGISEIPGIQS